eukprot:14227731-Alexandrium_andersonii.AAC.1
MCIRDRLAAHQHREGHGAGAAEAQGAAEQEPADLPQRALLGGAAHGDGRLHRVGMATLMRRVAAAG